MPESSVPADRSLCLSRSLKTNKEEVLYDINKFLFHLTNFAGHFQSMSVSQMSRQASDTVQCCAAGNVFYIILFNYTYKRFIYQETVSPHRYNSFDVSRDCLTTPLQQFWCIKRLSHHTATTGCYIKKLSHQTATTILMYQETVSPHSYNRLLYQETVSPHRYNSFDVSRDCLTTQLQQVVTSRDCLSTPMKQFAVPKNRRTQSASLLNFLVHTHSHTHSLTHTPLTYVLTFIHTHTHTHTHTHPTHTLTLTLTHTR